MKYWISLRSLAREPFNLKTEKRKKTGGEPFLLRMLSLLKTGGKRGRAGSVLV